MSYLTGEARKQYLRERGLFTILQREEEKERFREAQRLKDIRREARRQAQIAVVKPLRERGDTKKIYKNKISKLNKRNGKLIEMQITQKIRGLQISEDINLRKVVNVNKWFKYPVNTERFRDTPDYINYAIITACNNYVSSIAGADYMSWVLDGEAEINRVERVVRRPEEMRMRAIGDVLNIQQLFNEEIQTNDILTGQNCVTAWLVKKLGKKSAGKKQIMALGTKDGVTINELFDFCVKYNIFLIAYNINGKTIKTHKPEKYHNRLIFICHNNHFYPLKNKLLYQKAEATETQIKFVDNVFNEFKKFIEEDILPSDIKLNLENDNKICSFVVDKIKYICNPDYDECFKILKLLGIEEHIQPNTNFKNIMSIIEPLFTDKVNDTKSFFPHADQFVKGGLNYTADKINRSRPFVCIDKNKCYPYELSMLRHLLTFNFMQDRVFDIEDKAHNIIDHYIYVATPEKHQSVIMQRSLMPNKNLYTGEYLKLVRDAGMKFTLHEYIECDTKKNHYTELIDRLFKLCNPNILKNILNIYIGKFEICSEKCSTYNYKTVANSEQAQTTGGMKVKINDDYDLLYDVAYSYNIHNRKLISVQLKDMARYHMYEKIQEIGLRDEDIIYMETDSICFYTDRLDNFDINEHIKNKNDYKGWKDITAEFIAKKLDSKDINKKIKFGNNKHENIFNMCSLKNIKKPFLNNTLCIENAGSGKTYRIINDLIPSFKNQPYLVITPSHDTAADYRSLNLNVQVYQYFTLTHTMPSIEFTNIIIDEIGLFNRDGNELIYKLMLSNNYNIYAYGDYTQMKPPCENECFDNPLFLKMIYNKFESTTVNMRNNFYLSYYDDLRTNKNQNYLKGEVRRWSTKKYQDAEVIIAYYNKTVEMYNNMKLEDLGFDDMYQVGVSLLCYTNLLAKHKIYNKRVLKITNVTESKEGDIYTLSDEFDEFNLTYGEVSKNFRPSYCRTVYGVQGKSFKSYYYADTKRDYDMIDNRSAYTIISRIKQDLINDDEENIKDDKSLIIINDKINFDEDFEIEF